MRLLRLGPIYHIVAAHNDLDQLSRIAGLMASGKLKLHIDRRFPLAQVR